MVVPPRSASERAFQSSMEMMLSRLSELEEELEQVMLSLGAGYIGGKEEIDALWYRDVFTIDEQGRTVIKSMIKIPALASCTTRTKSKGVHGKACGKTRNRENLCRRVGDDDKSNICADCGASMTITGSLANTTDVMEKTVIVDMAESGASMKATHTCMNTYFMKNRTGEIVTITTALCKKYPPRFVEWKGLQPSTYPDYPGLGSRHCRIVSAG